MGILKTEIYPLANDRDLIIYYNDNGSVNGKIRTKNMGVFPLTSEELPMLKKALNSLATEW